jgi:signal transduction histidine kinase
MDKQKRGNLLVVDDDLGMREFLSFTLTGEGYSVVTASSGREALELFEQSGHTADEESSAPIDLTLMDIKMPPPEGIEVLRRMRQLDPDAVVVLITGYASLETAVQAVRHGAYDYLTKPLSDVNRLLSVVQRGLDRRRLLINSRRLLSQLRYAYEENLRLLEEMQSLNRDLEARITERTQKLERANRRLQEMDRLKSELLANVSHELYTPLNIILGFSQALLDGLHGSLSEEQSRLVENIQGSGRRLKSSFDDLTDMAKLSANEVVIHPQEVPLEPLVNGMQALIERSAGEKEIDINVELEPRVETVWADEAKLKRMLYELLSNAVRFTPPKGQISLRTFLHPTEHPDELHLQVADTGIGIPLDELEEIFDPFQQVDSSLSRRYGGLGLGLAVVRHYAELHGGRVWAESEPGHGSTFTLALPLPETVAG